MVTTPREVAEALINVGVPDDRARRIAHAVDPSQCTLSEEELAESIKTMRIGLSVLVRALRLSTEEQSRRALLDWQESIRVGVRLADEARWQQIKEKWDEQSLRAERQHRQQLLAIWGLGALTLIVWTAILVVVFLTTS